MSTMIVGELAAIMGLDDDPFQKGLDRAMSTGAQKAEQTGRKLTSHLSLPLAAVGVASAKLSLDFEKAFSRMQGLAGVSADEVDGLKESVMGLAGETGKAPQELADALYFIRSAGLAGQDALDALEMSAKGAAAGLGDTAAVADAVTSAMNGYGPTVLSAAKATDVLVATAREGKVEASQLGPQMGRLIPIAAELGISFDQVGAAVAFLSRSNGDASLTATMLSGVMSKLLKPSQMGAQALEAVGLSAQRVREMLNENGLAGTMQVLRERLGDTGFGQLFDDVQALQGALQMTGQASKDYIGVAERMGDVTGATDDAFAKWSQTMGFKNQQAFADLQVAMIKLGDIIVPLGADIASFASKFLHWFAALPEPVQKLVVVLGGALAAAGPLMTAWGRLDRILGTLGISTGGLRVALGAIAWPLAIAGAVAFAKSLDHPKVNVDALAAALVDLSGAERKQLEQSLVLASRWGQLNEVVKQTADSNLAAADRLLTVAESAGIQGEELDKLRKIVDDKRAADVQAAKDQETNTAAIDEATGGYDKQGAAVSHVTEQLQGFMDALSGMFDPLFAAQDAMLGLKDAQDKAAAATKEHGAKSTEAAAANRDLVHAALENEQAMVRLAAAVQSGEVPLGTAIGTLNRWVEQGVITRKAADEQIWAFTVLADKANDVPDEVGIEVTADTADAEFKLRTLKILAGEIVDPNLRASISYAGPSYRRAAGGPVWPGPDFLVGEDGPEVVRFGAPGQVFNADTTRRMLDGGGPMVPTSSATGGTTMIDQSQRSVTNHITTGMDPTETIAAVDRWTRSMHGVGFVEIVKGATRP